MSLFTTRNQQEAEMFINALPFSQEEKEVIRSQFGPMTKFMNEMKNNKKFNSKGGERWFSERVSGQVRVEVQKVQERFITFPPEQIDKLLFAATQKAFFESVLEICDECKCSDEVYFDLQECLSYNLELFNKHSKENDENQ